MKTKKLLVFLVMISVLVGTLGVFVGGETQGAEGEVVADLTFIPTPDPIEYGDTLKPGDEPIVPITLTPGTSDLSVSVSIAGDPLVVGILADRDEDTIYDPYNADSFTVTASTPLVFNTKLVVPVGQSSGTFSGTITYLVAEA